MPTDKEMYQVLLDADYTEKDIEESIGEGNTLKSIYDAHLEQLDEQAHEAGYEVGESSIWPDASSLNKNPHTEGSNEYEAWSRGWHQGFFRNNH